MNWFILSLCYFWHLYLPPPPPPPPPDCGDADHTVQCWLPFCKDCSGCHMTSSRPDSPPACVVLGRRRSRTSCSWATMVGPALLVASGSSAHRTLVAAQFTSFLSVAHASIVQGNNKALFPSTSSVLCPWLKRRNKDIAFTNAGGVYRLSADNPSAMGEVLGLFKIPPKSNLALKNP